MLLARHSLGARCKRCREVAIDQACKLTGIDVTSIDVHAIETDQALSEEQEAHLQEKLRDHGIELIFSQRDLLIERIRSAIGELVEPANHLRKISVIHYLPEKLCYSYSHLSKVFTDATGQSPEAFLISLKIERVKELLVRSHLTLTEVAYRLNYSSVAHLSRQFRRIVGQPASTWLQHVRLQIPTDQLPLEFEKSCNTYVNSCNELLIMVS
jgi:AraC-like DNA-binding protein